LRQYDKFILRGIRLPSAHHSQIYLADEAATVAFAGQLAQGLQAGMVIYLHGNLGAGKTTLVRGVLRALGFAGRVKSPTYTLIEQYQCTELNLRHFDLYRFQDAEEWEAAGFRDEFDGQNICLIEWPEQAAAVLPAADLDITFEILTSGRSVQLTAHNDSARACLKFISI
jgi:tRNA threonylcarbamoyladenosine biosynthesis protein TsaE